MCKILTVILWILLDYKKFSQPIDMVRVLYTLFFKQCKEVSLTCITLTVILQVLIDHDQFSRPV